MGGGHDYLKKVEVRGAIGVGVRLLKNLEVRRGVTGDPALHAFCSRGLVSNAQLGLEVGEPRLPHTHTHAHLLLLCPTLLPRPPPALQAYVRTLGIHHSTIQICNPMAQVQALAKAQVAVDLE